MAPTPLPPSNFLDDLSALMRAAESVAAQQPAPGAEPGTEPPADTVALPLYGQPAVQRPSGDWVRPAYLVVEHCLALGPHHVLLQGWAVDPDGQFEALYAQADEDHPPQELLTGGVRYGRADVEAAVAGLYAEAGWPVPAATAAAWCAVLPLGAGHEAVQLRLDRPGQFPALWVLPVRREPALLLRVLGGQAAQPWWGALVARLLAEPQAAASLAALLRAMPAPALESLLPAPDAAPADSAAGRLVVDHALRIGAGLFLKGWGLSARGEQLPGLLLRQPGAAQPTPVGLGRYIRHDVLAHLREHQRPVREQELGFVAWLPQLPGAEPDTAWQALVPDGQGGFLVQDLAVQDALAAPDAAAPLLLNAVPLATPDFQAVYGAHAGPALEALFAPRRERARPRVRLTHFGTPVADPEVSLIVPIYGRWDFIEHQVALFRHDPSLRRHELIYFVDDPAIHDGVIQYWHSTWPMYEQPFSVAYAGENLGFAGANNAAISVARGRRVLLLNSDVIPVRPGWLDGLIQALDAAPQAGVVGPTLLYGDGSVQHAGMEFERYPHWGHLWTNLHPGKGWPADWVVGDAPREVPALTGACMLLDKALYQAVGGLDEGYIRGDFEDSDLCLQLRARGLKPYLVPQVQLYHLERQSQDLNARMDTRMLLTLFNCWRHTRRWDADITRLMQEFSA